MTLDPTDPAFALRLCLAAHRRATALGLRACADGKPEPFAALLGHLDARDPEQAQIAATIVSLTPEGARTLLLAHPELGRARTGATSERRTVRVPGLISAREYRALEAEATRRGVGPADVVRAGLAEVVSEWARLAKT